jgi:lipoprotein-releasing system permease protein
MKKLAVKPRLTNYSETKIKDCKMLKNLHSLFSFSALEFTIALRYLKSKYREGFISVTAIFSLLGISIGVATLIIVMSVMNGFRYELVGRILGINSHLSLRSADGKIYNYQQQLQDLAKLDSQITYANPVIEGQAMISSFSRIVDSGTFLSQNISEKVTGQKIASQKVESRKVESQSAGALIRGIKYADLANKKLIANNITSGNLSSIANEDQIIIGSIIAEQMQLQVGDRLKIIAPTSNQTIFGNMPKIKTYKIGAVFNSGMYEYDSGTIFINFNIAQAQFNYQNSVSAIEIFTKDPENLSQVKNSINNYFVKENFYLIDWQESNASFIDALKVESTVMFLILTLIILVAAFNIISTMIMLVNDKKKNIALLRAMGFSSNSILRIFIICGCLIGAIGTIAGTIIGFSFAANINSIKLWLEGVTNSQIFNPAIYFLSTLPSKIFVSDLIIIISMSLAISFFATIYPARKASKTNPANILRY